MAQQKHEIKQKGFNKLQFFICLILLIAWGSVMLILSSQNGEQTAGLSYTIAEKLSAFIYGNADFAKINFVHTVIRKLAHVGIYAVFGVVIYLLTVSFHRLKNALGVVISSAAVVCFSVLDELHKLTISGRHCDIEDICLNILGGVIGIAVVWIICMLIGKIRVKNSRGES